MQSIPYIDRDRCVISKKNDLESRHSLNNFPIFIGCTNEPASEDLFANMNFSISKSSGVIQLKNLLPLERVYQGYHSEAIGGVWSDHHNAFVDFLISNIKVGGIIEMGGSSGVMAEKALAINPDLSWTIVEPNLKPSYVPSTKNIKLIDSLIENAVNDHHDFSNFIHSHVLEHLYNPLDVLEVVSQKQKDGDRSIFSIPDLYYYLDNNFVNTLNFEHTFFLTEEISDYLIQLHGYSLIEKIKFKNHSIFYCIEKNSKISKPELSSNLYYQYKEMYLNMVDFYNNDLANIQNEIEQHAGEVYLFGAHVFSQYLLNIGLDELLISGILDNSKEKEGKRLYGSNLTVFNPTIIQGTNNYLIIVKAGAYQDEVELQLKSLNPNIKIVR